MSVKQENVKWVDGLRGFASLLVVLTHIARSFDEALFLPASAEGAKPRVAQWPFIRILFQGRVGVHIFALVTGYVCALKPIRQCRAGQQEAMFSGISKSAFRRVPRLVLPTTIATTLIWFVTQFGVFEVGTRVEGWWLNFTSPKMTPFIGKAVKTLLINGITTWTKSWNIYDNNQWTLLPLLKGSMLVYMMLIATAYVKPRYRMMASFGMFIYYYISNDPVFGMQFFFGMFLSDLSQSPSHTAWCQARKWPSRIISPIFILFGLYLASYPEDKAQWAYWSTKMGHYSVWIFPEGNDTPRFYSAIGLEFAALGIHFSPSVKNFLSNRYLLYFGKNSFAVYLIHGSLLRSVLVWMYFGFSTPADIVHADGHREPGPNLKLCGNARFFFWLPIWFVMLYTCAHYWTKFVDPWCARLTEKWVKYTFDTPPPVLPKEERRPDPPTKTESEKPLLEGIVEGSASK
ncbi:acyltransferase 3 [Amylocarpus encephaloides]|uniref:Acyltransferase 3 n=1 Tax=Amylocarpus encephaloides TaxID=45428 RepID=A0A9P7YI43_9HELO|nr:acyltransferase 3 [Amylocarpus encephaloides]